MQRVVVGRSTIAHATCIIGVLRIDCRPCRSPRVHRPCQRRCTANSSLCTVLYICLYLYTSIYICIYTNGTINSPGLARRRSESVARRLLSPRCGRTEHTHVYIYTRTCISQATKEEQRYTTRLRSNRPARAAGFSFIYDVYQYIRRGGDDDVDVDGNDCIEIARIYTCADVYVCVQWLQCPRCGGYWSAESFESIRVLGFHHACAGIMLCRAEWRGSFRQVFCGYRCCLFILWGILRENHTYEGFEKLKRTIWRHNSVINFFFSLGHAIDEKNFQQSKMVLWHCFKQTPIFLELRKTLNKIKLPRALTNFPQEKN